MTIAIIDGKKYDTETATFIGEIGEGVHHGDRGDFRWWLADLYVTERGNFFMDGRGNAMSPFREAASPSSWTNGSGIKALDPQKALSYCEKYLGADIYEQYFDIEEA